MRIEIVVYDGFDELDAFGPYEVLSHAAQRLDDWEVVLVTLGAPAKIVSAHGVSIDVDETLGGGPAPDGAIVVGGGWSSRRAGVRAEIDRGVLPRRLADLAPRSSWTASVCTGALLLAAAGLTRGRRATTHAAAMDEFAATGAVVQRNARVVDDGDLLTAGGVTSGLDLALHLVAREADPDVAAAVADNIAHEAEPAEVRLSSSTR